MLTIQTEMTLLTLVAGAVLGFGLWRIAKIGWRTMLPPASPEFADPLGQWCSFVFLIMWIPQLFAARLMGSAAATNSNNTQALLISSAAVFPLQLGALFLVSRFGIGRAVWSNLLTRQKPAADLACGFFVLLALFPVTIAINLIVRLIVSQWAGGPKLSEHVLVQMASNPNTENWVWALIAIQSIIMAPIREEIFFRGAMQPWFIQQKHGGWIALAMAAAASVLTRPEPNGLLDALAPPMFTITVGLTLFVLLPKLNPNAPSPLWRYLFSKNDLDPIPATQAFRGIVGSTMLFAMFHSASWPDPIPLVALGLGLGWLAWRTRSVIGSIVCHAVFNAATIYQLRMISLQSS